jgi:hypothetical protein
LTNSIWSFSQGAVISMFVPIGARCGRIGLARRMRHDAGVSYAVLFTGHLSSETPSLPLAPILMAEPRSVCGRRRRE